ncbi:MAG TPA: ion channel [Polyangiaceae bacterium]|nr:ion channel [Polyangiaceae bacterium]
MAPKNSSSNPLSGVVVVGAPRAPFRDLHHRFLRAPWWLALSAIVATFLTLNAGFALLYLVTGGVKDARPGSFLDVFFFSVQTMGTIGYGDMHPVSTAANWLVVCEAVVSLILTAVATGLIFSKFSQLQARVAFTSTITITPMDGVPTMMFRLGNERGNQIVEALLHVVMLRTEHTREGMTFYKMIDIPLVRERSQAFTRSWTAMHSITKDSPLYGVTEAQMNAEEMEFIVSMIGTDDTSLQPVHARRHYTHKDVLWGARHADILTEQKDGTIILDLTKFHDTVPTKATPEFPYGLPA